jgi:cation diffusion facilitator family transporter
MKEKFEYPDHLVSKFERAKKLEWFSIFYILSSTVVTYITMGNSQTMKTAWLEDALSLAPPISFLIASRLCLKPRNKEFPFGYHRVVTLAYLCSAISLLVVGLYLFFDSASVLLKREHPSIGSVLIGGHQVWLGFLMMAALLYSSVPVVILGRKKLNLSLHLHEKNLYTDAQMNKADWMTALAAIIGITGIGFGWWWADATAAILISADILHDGLKNVKQAVFDLLSQIPKTVDNNAYDPLLKKVQEILNREDWITKSTIRLREEGHIYFGEAFVIPATEKNVIENAEASVKKVKQLSWLIYEFNIIPVKSLRGR